MQLIRAQGTPAEVGLAVGASAAPLVGAAIGLICRFELPREQVDRRLELVEQRLTETFPAALEEAEGLAEGAGVERRDALALSVCADIDGRLPAWCSLVAVASEQGVLLGRNLDVPAGLGPLQVLERIEREGTHGFTHLTTAGAMWCDGGVNDAGLALVNASVLCSERNPDGVPDGILVREILARCRDVPEAVAMATRFDVMTLGENILLADAAGRVALIEKLPGGQAVQEGAPLAVCNHVRSPDLAPLASRADPIRPNSEQRLSELRRQLERAERGGGGWTVERIASLLASHAGGVCQHGSAGLFTAASLILAPRTREFWIADGPPCTHRFQPVGDRAPTGPRPAGEG